MTGLWSVSESVCVGAAAETLSYLSGTLHTLPVRLQAAFTFGVWKNRKKGEMR